ncbi:hypothetical protein BK131_19185 [Paenibacillus amylolyticus]|uniref:Uncharacterized protein n=1 Tax=Paenibacillus amylolyticus TaxID=1451 RepID=A0A1R1BQH5_PAEAM|nr:hypothetical protein [Paenibacillus amylolyticus]OMF12129.1 hypothetical protein BK131_19185 [Paenibacillus amylolyticus]
MSFRIGLSSGSMPNLTANELIQKLNETGCNTVDLRVGKGHSWEEEGLTPLRQSGIDIAFIGISFTLGDDRFDKETLIKSIAPYADIPLKVFSKPGCTTIQQIESTQKQVQVLASIAGGMDRIWVETHKGNCGVEELVRISELLGTRVLLDTLGLACISKDPLEATTSLMRFISGVQTKGFNWDNPYETIHVPLSETDINRTYLILQKLADTNCSVTVETRSGSAVEDIKVLQSLLARESE